MLVWGGRGDLARGVASEDLCSFGSILARFAQQPCKVGWGQDHPGGPALKADVKPGLPRPHALSGWVRTRLEKAQVAGSAPALRPVSQKRPGCRWVGAASHDGATWGEGGGNGGESGKRPFPVGACSLKALPQRGRGFGVSFRSEEPDEKRRAGPVLGRPPRLFSALLPVGGEWQKKVSPSAPSPSRQGAPLPRRPSRPGRGERLSGGRLPRALGGPRPKEAPAPASHGPAGAAAPLRKGGLAARRRAGESRRTAGDTGRHKRAGAHVHANWAQRHAQQFLWLVDEAFVGVVQAACSAETEDIMANCNV